MSEFGHINLSLEEASVDCELRPYFEASARFHHHLCPRQVLGVRIGLVGLQQLNLKVPIRQKRLLVIVETDGCFISGVQAATGCSVNRRTMRIEDIGRIAATFIDVKTEAAIRVAPHVDARVRALQHAGAEHAKRRDRYIAMLQAYQTIPSGALLTIEQVRLTRPIQEMISRPFLRVTCAVCNEEIINQREQRVAGQPVCQACLGTSYYDPAPVEAVKVADRE